MKNKVILFFALCFVFTLSPGLLVEKDFWSSKVLGIASEAGSVNNVSGKQKEKTDLKNQSNNNTKTNAQSNGQNNDIEDEISEKKEFVKEVINGRTYVNGIIIVNKKHSLPKTYAPGENKEAKKKLMEMIDHMLNLGFKVSKSYSGYRSYEYQDGLYKKYVKNHSKEEAERFSARAGHSEHQTGLAFDLRNWSGKLIGQSDKDAKMAKWLSENAHKYGFIIRYLPGKEEITGYIHEPWHIRYVGDIATDIYESKLTLEEYFEIEGGDYK